MRFISTKLFFQLLFTIFLMKNAVAQQIWVVNLKTVSDAEYPNNNQIGFKSKLDGAFSHQVVVISELPNGNFDFAVLPANPSSDTLFIYDVNVLEMMPTVPDFVKNDDYLSFLSILNQEWNRIQVKFNPKQFAARGKGTEKTVATRVDVANNCLAKGLWEVIAFTAENGNDVMYFQCWFDFPVELYDRLFEKRNGFSIVKYDDMLKNYSHATAEKVNLNRLRKVQSEKEISFKNLNSEYYPLKGERETKLKNVVFPTNITKIDDFLTDNTTFSTFAAPGMYTRGDPRKTELARFQKLEKTVVLQTISANAAAIETTELQLTFSDKLNTKKTKYVIGGLLLDKLPLLNLNTMHKGWQRPMGVSNHSFYSSIDEINAASSAQNPYFSVLLNENGKWLDSHDIGIDGILLFRDESMPEKVHALILAFERHAFVGHFVFSIKPNVILTAVAPPKTNDILDEKLVFTGDMRSRLVERDWDVTTADGKILEPRTRFRVRMRFGFNYNYSKNWSFGARIRTGSPNEQQSPHVTLGANESSNIPIGADRAFIKYSNKSFTIWTGKHTFPFYTHDDLFVTQDISPEGIYSCYEIKVGNNLKLKPAGAFFIINSLGKSFKKDQTMKAFQLHAVQKSNGNELNISTGLFVIDSVGGATDGTGTFKINYHDWMSNMKFTFGKFKIPISIAGNLMINNAKLEDCFVVKNGLANEKSGFSTTLEIGQLKTKNDFLFSATYAHIEKYSVLDYFAQDDWMRWGFSGASGTRGSNFEGFELRAGYAFGANCNLIARTYLIKGIAPNKMGATLETNNRFRLDLNIGF
jgi:Putative porin